MLFYLPIAIVMGLSPIPVSDAVPRFDVTKECGFEGGPAVVLDRCSRDEADAFQKLQAEWSQFDNADKKTCVTEATVADLPSYVELLVCLEMAGAVRNDQTNSHRAVQKAAPQSQRKSPEANIVDRSDPTGLRSDH